MIYLCLLALFIGIPDFVYSSSKFKFKLTDRSSTEYLKVDSNGHDVKFADDKNKDGRQKWKLFKQGSDTDGTYYRVENQGEDELDVVCGGICGGRFENFCGTKNGNTPCECNADCSRAKYLSGHNSDANMFKWSKGDNDEEWYIPYAGKDGSNRNYYYIVRRSNNGGKGTDRYLHYNSGKATQGSIGDADTFYITDQDENIYANGLGSVTIDNADIIVIPDNNYFYEQLFNIQQQNYYIQQQQYHIIYLLLFIPATILLIWCCIMIYKNNVHQYHNVKVVSS